MKRWFSMLLLVGALVGLFGQETAFAFAISSPAAQEANVTSGMSADCAEMMGLAKSQKDQPCQGMTFDCIAKMGCAVPLAIVPPVMAGIPFQYRSVLPAPLLAARLSGRDLIPEPHPPSLLG